MDTAAIRPDIIIDNDAWPNPDRRRRIWRGFFGVVNISTMSAEEAVPEGLGAVFRWYLNSAITLGLMPSRATGLGSHTCDAIERVAGEHPEADVALIAGAYDAFAREHRGVNVPVERLDLASAVPQRRGANRKKQFRVR